MSNVASALAESVTTPLGVVLFRKHCTTPKGVATSSAEAEATTV